MDGINKYDIKTAPVSEAEIDLLAEIFAELIRNSLNYRKEADNNVEKI